MCRRSIAFVVAVSSILSASIARAEETAQGLADSGLIVGLERVVTLVNYVNVTASPPNGGQSSTVSVTSLAFLATDPGGPGDSFPVSPRLAVDGVFGPHLTLGGAAWIFADVSYSVSSGGMSRDQPKRTYGGIAPRVGWILPLTDSLSFWPRAGVEYETLSSASSTTSAGGTTITSSGASLNQLSADIEANLVYSPYRHIGFELELYGAIPISGNASIDQGNGTSTNIGLAGARRGTLGRHDRLLLTARLPPPAPRP
jgi:hypothetical protein